MRNVRKYFTVLAAPLLLAILPGAPAMAAGPPGNGTFFQLEIEAAPGLCLQENGTTSGVYLGSCSTTNHSDLWYNPTGDIFEIANLHSGLCLSVTGFEASVYLNNCVFGQHAQDWQAAGLDEIQNLHTHYCLWQSGNTQLQQRNSCDDSNVHDLWLIL